MGAGAIDENLLEALFKGSGFAFLSLLVLFPLQLLLPPPLNPHPDDTHDYHSNEETKENTARGDGRRQIQVEEAHADIRSSFCMPASIAQVGPSPFVAFSPCGALGLHVGAVL